MEDAVDAEIKTECYTVAYQVVAVTWNTDQALPRLYTPDSAQLLIVQHVSMMVGSLSTEVPQISDSHRAKCKTLGFVRYRVAISS